MRIYRHFGTALRLMWPRHIVLILAVVLLNSFTETATAQQNSDGSLYSRFGLGELFNFSSSQIQAMGGGGYALTSLNYVNLANPATFSNQSLTRIGASVQFQGIEISDDQGGASRLNSSMLEAFLFSFPIRRGKSGIALSYVPYTRVAHKVQEAPVAIETSLQDPASYVLTFEGSGGLQKASLGFGTRPLNNVRVGLSADFLFGILRESRQTEIFADDVGSTLFFDATNQSNSTRLSGFTTTLGTLVTLPQPFFDNDALVLGFSVSLPTTLQGTRTITFGQSLDQDTIGVAIKGDIDLPLRGNAGISYHPDSRWTFIADLTLDSWSDFDSELSLPGFTPGGASSFKNRTRFSTGIDFQPSSNILDSYFSRIAYRLGYYFDTGYIDPIANTDLNTYGFTGGLSMPTLFPGTRIDINLEVGRRGTTDFNLVKETFYKIRVNVNIGERWFERRKLG